MYDLKQLSQMPWCKWQQFFLEDLCCISHQLGLDWVEVKRQNSVYSRKRQNIPSNAKIASYLRRKIKERNQK
jgi:hypothetical protein